MVLQEEGQHFLFLAEQSKNWSLVPQALAHILHSIGNENPSLTISKYEHTTHLGKGPSPSLSGKTIKKMESTTPGPGAYDVATMPHKKSSFAYTIGPGLPDHFELE